VRRSRYRASSIAGRAWSRKRQAQPPAARFAIRMSPSSFETFDVFADEDGRQAHLSGKVATALMERAPELLAEDPKIAKLDVLADKFP
jgi:quinol monooxygenase YgiN